MSIQIFFSDWEPQACSFAAYRCSRGVMRIPGRLIRLAVGIDETEYERFSYIHGRYVPCVYTLYFKRIPTSIKNEILILWKLQICNTRLSSTRQAPSIFFFIGVEAYPKSWQTPIFYSQTLNTREGDAGNSHYKILYVKLSFSLCILTCRVPKMWVGQSSPHFSTCMYICKFNKKVSVINFF